MSRPNMNVPLKATSIATLLTISHQLYISFSCLVYACVIHSRRDIRSSIHSDDKIQHPTSNCKKSCNSFSTVLFEIQIKLYMDACVGKAVLFQLSHMLMTASTAISVISVLSAWVIRSHRFCSKTCSGRRPLGKVVGRPSRHTTNDVKAVTETQSTDLNPLMHKVAKTVT